MAEQAQKEVTVTHQQYAFVMSVANKCNITVAVGPTTKTISSQERAMRFDPRSGKFVECEHDPNEAVCQFITAGESDYVVLDNPAKNPDQAHPPIGQEHALVQLDYGRRVIIRGNTTFALWPGQVAEVIQGHRLRSNEYLVVRIVNPDAARANWEERVEKPQMLPASEESEREADEPTRPEKPTESDTPEGTTQIMRPLEDVRAPTEPSPTTSKPTPEPSGDGIQYDADDKPILTNGQLLVIKGTDVSFYIPPTGVEVVRDDHGRYVRSAVTLEQLEYCILLDESGTARHVHGPDVVFPSPTETFVEGDGSKKFQAIELSPIQGIYVKVIEGYAEDHRHYEVGQELFITGTEQMVYFPRQEHNIVQYGDRIKHFAVEIPPGDARYVLHRINGAIRLEKGPSMFLPDPRKEVLILRALPPRKVRLWYPGNEEALQWNASLSALASEQEGSPDFVTDRHMRSRMGDDGMRASDFEETLDRQRSRQRHPGRSTGRGTMQRGDSFVAPMTAVMDPRFLGAVSISVWNGYAIQVVKKDGRRRVVAGPETVLLEFDEDLAELSLSSGTPKTSAHPVSTVYLRITNNRVSDLIDAETSDLVQVQIKLALRVNFEDKERCFDVEDYVGLLCDHIRSMIRGAVKQQKIEEFYANAVAIIRDTILGKPGEGRERPGRKFDENGMRVYDVEVLDVRITDRDIEHEVAEAQRVEVRQMLALRRETSALRLEQARQKMRIETAEAKNAAEERLRELLVKETAGQLAATLKELEAEAKRSESRHKNKLAEQGALDQLESARLKRERLSAEQQLELEKGQQALRLAMIAAETEASEKTLKAVQPELIATLRLLSEQGLAAILAEKLPGATGTLGLLTEAGGIKGLLAMVQGTPLEKGFRTFLKAVEKVGESTESSDVSDTTSD